MVVMGERTITLESEQQQMLLQLRYQRVTRGSLLESLAQPLKSSSAMCPSTLATTTITIDETMSILKMNYLVYG